MITVLLFAELEEKAGQREIQFDEEALTIKEIREKLESDYPKLTNISSAMPAVNEEYAEDSKVVKSGDTVAFIPPVSGG